MGETKWYESIAEVDAFRVQGVQGQKLPLRYANAALRGQSWMASLQLLRSVQVPGIFGLGRT